MIAGQGRGCRMRLAVATTTPLHSPGACGALIVALAFKTAPAVAKAIGFDGRTE
jgi:hypothetical protein